MRGGERDDGAPGAHPRALAVGDAGNGPRRFLGGERAFLELDRRGIGIVVGSEIRRRALQQPVLRREAGIGVLRRLPRHGDGALHQGGERVGGKVGGGDAGRASADEEAQADFLALGAGHVLQFAEAHLHLGRGIADIEDVGRIGPGFSGGVDQGAGAPFRLTDAEHRGDVEPWR